MIIQIISSIFSNCLELLLLIFLYYFCFLIIKYNIMDHSKGKQNQKDNYRGHFCFNKAEVILHMAFVISIIYLAFFQMMPRLVNSYPPQQHNLKQSIFTSILGKKRDCHDDQWEAYRTNLPIMLITMFAWKYLILIIAPKEKVNKWMRSCYLGIGILTFTYRADIFLYSTVILIWFGMTKLLYKTRIIIPLSWFIVIFVLYLNQKYNHLRFISAWFEQFVPDSLWFFKNSQAPLLWTNILNMNFLKMLSFTMDCHWGYSQQQFKRHHDKCTECNKGDLCYRGRDLYKLPQMSVKNYLDYMFFAPTCLAGPPISFTNFFSFEQIPTTKRPPYLRTAFLIIFSQLYLHYYPVLKPDPSQSLVQMSLISLFFLYFIYLKFAVIWRVGRMWALMYGVDTIQNMGRCMYNNYGFEKFWRMWHKGFNHWLIRYMYIPLGGNKNILSVFCVILFVAFWHDHTFHILIWAMILVLFMIPEIAVKTYFRKNQRKWFPNQNWPHWFKYLCALACSFYIQIICYCNLIGFGYGFDNAKVVLNHIKNQNINFIFTTTVAFSGTILMFYIRQVQIPKRND